MNEPANPTVRLKIERRSNHPWIFQKMVDKPEPRPKPGSVVEIVDRDGTWAGRGFYNGHSRIALRVLSADPDEAIDEDYFIRKIADATSLRRVVLGLDRFTDAYRLFHSEGDGLSGLVVDRFGDTLVIEYFSAGMYRVRDLVRRALDVCDAAKLIGHDLGVAVVILDEQRVQRHARFAISARSVTKRSTPAVIHEWISLRSAWRAEVC